jgi:hypothetical protein
MRWLEANPVVLSEKAFYRRLSIDHGGDNFSVGDVICLADENKITVVNAIFDHTATLNSKTKDGLSTGIQKGLVD